MVTEGRVNPPFLAGIVAHLRVHIDDVSFSPELLTDTEVIRLNRAVGNLRHMSTVPLATNVIAAYHFVLGITFWLLIGVSSCFVDEERVLGRTFMMAGALSR